MKVETKEIVTKEYVITLTEKEAIVLKSLCGSILDGGSVRVFCDRLYNDLTVKSEKIFGPSTIRMENYL